jgi:hypothetical protein
MGGPRSIPWSRWASRAVRRELGLRGHAVGHVLLIPERVHRPSSPSIPPYPIAAASGGDGGGTSAITMGTASGA